MNRSGLISRPSRPRSRAISRLVFRGISIAPWPAVTDRLVEAMAGYARAARAGNAWRAYEADLRHFAAWCEHHRLAPLSAAPATAADMTVGRT